MTGKPTPGPYELGEFQPGNNLPSGLSSAEITPVGEFAILAHVYRPDRSKAEGEANAHLFVAAPQMREALEKVIPYMEAAESAGLVGDEGCHWPVEEVRTALKAADGEGE